MQISKAWSSLSLSRIVGVAAVVALLLVLTVPNFAATAVPAGPALPSTGASPMLDAIKKRGALRGCVATLMPVVGQTINSGTYVGTGVDFGTELAKRLSVKLELVPSGWDGLIANVQTGKCDIILASLTFRPQRAEVVDYVFMGMTGYCVMALKSNDKVTSWKDVTTKQDVIMAVVTGTGRENQMRNEFPNVQIRSLPVSSEVVLVNEVLARRADVSAIDTSLVSLVMQEHPELKVIPNDCLINPLSAQRWGHAVLKGDGQFHQWVNAVADTLKASGWVDQRWKYWSDPERMRGTKS